MRPQNIERMRCVRDIERICDVKSSSGTCLWTRDYSPKQIKHVEYFKDKDRQTFILDSPYIPSQHLDNEHLMLGLGWRILHLPLHMTFHIVGKSQPRLIAPPKSKIDLTHIVKMLAFGGFIGNTTLTHEFIGRDYPCKEESARWYTMALESNFGEYLNERP